MVIGGKRRCRWFHSLSEELGVGRWNRVGENIVDEINDRRWFEGNPFARYKASESKAVLEARH